MTRRQHGDSPVSLRRGTDGQYALVDAKAVPIVEANGFLRAAALRGLAATTLRAYAFDLLAVYRWLGSKGQTITRLAPSDAMDFIAMQKEGGAQAATINRRLMVLRVLYHFTTGRELESGVGALLPSAYYRGRGRERRLGLHWVPRAHRVKLRVKAPRRIVEPLTADQVREFMRTLRRYRDLAIVHLLLLCGLRSAEVLQLRILDVSFVEQHVRVRGKGRTERIVPVADFALRLLADYLRWERPRAVRSAQLFVVLQGHRRGQPMTLSGLRSLFRHRRRRPEIALANPHRFRHTFGADMARAGVGLPMLQRMMGHADPATTLKYIELSMADIAEEYRRASRTINVRYRPE